MTCTPSQYSFALPDPLEDLAGAPEAGSRGGDELMRERVSSSPPSHPDRLPGRRSPCTERSYATDLHASATGAAS